MSTTRKTLTDILVAGGWVRSPDPEDPFKGPLYRHAYWAEKNFTLSAALEEQIHLEELAVLEARHAEIQKSWEPKRAEIEAWTLRVLEGKEQEDPQKLDLLLADLRSLMEKYPVNVLTQVSGFINAMNQMEPALRARRQ